MGMPISLALRGRHAEDYDADAAWQEALASLRDTDRIFSTYREDSVICRLQRGEVGLDECPDVVREVLALGEQARVESGGAFDMTRPGVDGVPCLDPSGVVKGWAVERAARAFDALEQTDVCLSAGGDMVCRTRMPDSPGWRIGIENPFDPSQILAVVPIRDGAVATSGLARRGAHIIDPRTAQVPTDLASATVIGPDLTWADIDATTAFVLGSQAPAWLAGRPGRTGLLVRSDGSTEIFGQGEVSASTSSGPTSSGASTCG
ncbi:MAG: ApbE family protein [Marmoricola sp.]|nr:ApbE family protein [Marmoricola sp.]